MTQHLPNLVASIPNDKDYPYVPIRTPFAPSVDLKPDVFEIEDQGAIGSCTANATTSALEHMLKWALRPLSLSRLFNYYQSRIVIEGYTGEGANLRDAVRAAYHYGAPAEATWPYIVSQENIAPSTTAYAEGLTRKVTRYERIAMGMYDDRVTPIKSALNEGLPVIFAITLCQDFYNLKGQKNWKTQTYNDNYSQSNQIIGNHAMLIVGYDDSVGKFLIENSWGPGFGDGGFIGLTYTQIQDCAFDAWVIRGFNGIENYQGPQPPAPPLVVKVTPDPLINVVPAGQTKSNLIATLTISGGVAPWTVTMNGWNYPQSANAPAFQNSSVHIFTTDTQFTESVPITVTDLAGTAVSLTLNYQHILTTPTIVTTPEQDTTQSLYLAYLGRPADRGGMDFWSSILKQQGVPIVLKGITNSPEYMSRYQSVSQADIDAANKVTFA